MFANKVRVIIVQKGQIVTGEWVHVPLFQSLSPNSFDYSNIRIVTVLIRVLFARLQPWFGRIYFKDFVWPCDYVMTILDVTNSASCCTSTGSMTTWCNRNVQWCSSGQSNQIAARPSGSKRERSHLLFAAFLVALSWLLSQWALSGYVQAL